MSSASPGSATPPREETIAGCAGIVAGAVVVAMVGFDPRGLRAPDGTAGDPVYDGALVNGPGRARGGMCSD